MKFKAPFYGKKAGEIYPTRFQIGDECPPELEAAARSVDALDESVVEPAAPVADAAEPAAPPAPRRKRKG